MFRARGTGGSGLSRSLSPALAGLVKLGGLVPRVTRSERSTLGFMLSVRFADSLKGFSENRLLRRISQRRLSVDSSQKPVEKKIG